MRRTQDHWSSVRQGLIRLAVARARQKNASEEELSMLTSLSSSTSLSSKASSKSSTKTVIEMRYTESIPDFRFLEESINWVDQKLVSFTRLIWVQVQSTLMMHKLRRILLSFSRALFFILWNCFRVFCPFLSFLIFPWHHWFTDSFNSSTYIYVY